MVCVICGKDEVNETTKKCEETKQPYICKVCARDMSLYAVMDDIIEKDDDPNDITINFSVWACFSKDSTEDIKVTDQEVKYNLLDVGLDSEMEYEYQLTKDSIHAYRGFFDRYKRIPSPEEISVLI